MADAGIQFWGLYHLAFSKVSAFIGGLDCGDYVVDGTGSITVPMASDPGALLSQNYLQNLATYTGEQATTITFGDTSTATVSVVIGLAYTSQMQMLRASAADDIKSPTGGALGKRRRVHRFAVLLQNCIANTLYFGSDLSATGLRYPAALRDASDAPGSEIVGDGSTMFSGVYRSEANDDYGFDGMIACQINRPMPATIVQMAAHLEAAED